MNIVGNILSGSVVVAVIAVCVMLIFYAFGYPESVIWKIGGLCVIVSAIASLKVFAYDEAVKNVSNTNHK
ncbi:hypothetical protein A1QO_03855 [Vibrio genomosp. F10 str. ZF-129]|uniref:Uncharacterized protein n=1 Tax=Vibrio genomosp. F10 str. ZF-129 TaxID=1187848 RepID=A0A1E5BJL9_9VIBR|nr:hypothetical protein A1QO_03855 [Vibrio genomosp. F10 str. ZF-129]